MEEDESGGQAGGKKDSEPDLESIIERKVKERTRELEEKIERLEKQEKTGTDQNDAEAKKEVSRRRFLKLAGVGAGSLALSSTAAGWFSVNQNAGASKGTQTLSEVLTEGNDVNGQNIVDGGTTIWDSGNSYVPASSINESNLDANTLQGNTPNEIGGPNYIQDTEPSNPSDGETWIDTSNPARPVSVYSADRGEWVATFDSVPLFVTQEALTFEESNIQLTTGNAIVDSGSVELEDSSEESSSSADEDTYFNESGWHGIRITPNKPIKRLRLGFFPNTDEYGNSTVNDLRVVRVSDSEVIKSISGNWEIFEFPDYPEFDVSLESGVSYDIEANIDGVPISPSESFPVTNPIFDVVGPSSNRVSGDDHWQTFDYIRATSNITEGSTTIGFNRPEDLSSWDRVSWQADDGGGSVSATIETNDGTGWSSFASDVAAPYSIASVPADHDVRVRFDLSRPTDDDTSPRVSYVARRGER